MLKAEKYKESIKELAYSFALVKGEIKDCQIVDCESCEFGETSGCTAIALLPSLLRKAVTVIRVTTIQRVATSATVSMTINSIRPKDSGVI